MKPDCQIAAVWCVVTSHQVSHFLWRSALKNTWGAKPKSVRQVSANCVVFERVGHDLIRVTPYCLIAVGLGQTGRSLLHQLILVIFIAVCSCFCFQRLQVCCDHFTAASSVHQRGGTPVDCVWLWGSVHWRPQACRGLTHSVACCDLLLVARCDALPADRPAHAVVLSQLVRMGRVRKSCAWWSTPNVVLPCPASFPLGFVRLFVRMRRPVSREGFCRGSLCLASLSGAPLAVWGSVCPRSWRCLPWHSSSSLGSPGHNSRGPRRASR